MQILIPTSHIVSYRPHQRRDISSFS